MNRLLLVPLFLLALCLGTAHAAPLNIDTVREPHSLLPNFTWLADPEGTYTINTVTSGAVQDRFASLRGGFPVEAKGKAWLHLVLTKNPTNPAQPGANANASPVLSMKLGAVPGGEARLFRLQTSGALVAADTWSSETIADGEEYPLPTPGGTPLHMYIQLADTPGLWFHPSVTPQASLTPPILPLDMVLPGLFILGIAVCLLRAAKERAAWAVWGALFLGACLTQLILPLPRLDIPFTYSDLPVLLAPGLALMLLPHLGRHMLQTHQQGAVQDTLLACYSFLGLALCLAPLVPSMYWIARLFPLWPFLLIPLLPFCLWGLAAKRSGSLAFSGACAMPVIGAVITFFSIDADLPHPLAPLGTYWGLAIGGLGLCLARVQRPDKEQTKESALFINDGEQAHPSFHELFQRDPLFPEARTKSLRINKALPDFLDPLPDTPAASGTPGAPDARQQPLSLQEPALPPAQSTQTSASGQQQPAPEQTTAHAGMAQEPAAASAGQAQEPAMREPAVEQPIQVQPVARDLPDLEMPQPSGAIPPPRASLADNPLFLAEPSATVEAKTTQVPPERLDLHAVPFSPGTPPARPAPATEALDINIPALQARATPPSTQPAPKAPPRAEEPTATVPPTAKAAPVAAELPTPQAPAVAPETAPAPSPSEEAVPPAITPEASPLPAAPVPPAAAPGSETSSAPVPPVRMASAPGPAPETAADAVTDAPAQTVISLTDDTSPDEYNFLSGVQPVLGPATGHTAPQAVSVFHLHTLVKSVHEAVVPLAKSKGLLSSWYIAPSTPPLLEGEAASLRQALFLLLQSAVNSTAQGSVQLAVRSTGGTGHTCTLTFSISDTGGAQRSDAGFYHAWDLASRTGGTFSVEYTATTGPVVSFSVGFRLPEKDALSEAFTEDSSFPLPVEGDGPFAMPPEQADAGPDTSGLSPEEILQEQGFLEPRNGSAPTPASAVRILVADMTTSNRHLITHYLEPVAYELLEARDTNTAIALGREQPVNLIIVDGDMPEADIAKAIQAVRAAEREHNRLPAAILALTTHEGQSRRLLGIGCTHALCKPFSKEELLAQVLHCVPALREQQPRLLPQGGAPARPEEERDEGLHYVHRLLGSVEPTRRSGQSEPRSVLHISPKDVLPPLSGPESAPSPLPAFPDLPPADAATTAVPGASTPGSVSAAASGSGAAPPVMQDAPATAEDTPVAAATQPQAPSVPSARGRYALGPAFNSTLAIRIPAESAPGKPPAIHAVPRAEAGTVASDGGAQPPAPVAPAAQTAGTGSPADTLSPARQEKSPEDTGHTPKEVAFLDLIVADDEAPATPQPAAAAAAPEVPAEAALAEAPREMPPPQHQATASAAPGTPAANAPSPEQPVPPRLKNRIIVTVNPPGKKQPAKTGEAGLQDAALAPVEGGTALSTPAPAAAQPQEPAAATPHADAPAPTAQEPPATATAEEPAHGLPLPGIDGELMDIAMVPLVPGLVHTLHDAIRDAMHGKETRQTILVQEAAGRLAGKAEVFGLVKLGKIARCVERAAEADDLEAVGTLLEDLNAVTTRYAASIEACYQAFLHTER